jgi:integrase
LEWQRRFENGDSEYTPTRARSTVRGNSPTVINACIAYLRRVFDIAVNEGLIGQNPARSMKRKKPGKKLLELPSVAQFRDIVANVRKSRARWGEAAADFIEGLAYSGMRKEEASRLTWSDINFDRGVMVVRGTKTETSSRTVPLIPAMQDLLSRIQKDGPKVFKANSALTSLSKACAAVGVRKLTHHDLRHLFATTCIEAGVDIPTVSRWLGHADGGALAMKTYGHLRPLHSTEAAAKVKF